MVKKILTLAVLTTVLAGAVLLSSKPALSAIRCETQYGGEEVCVKIGELYINKEVKNPDTGLFVDNLFLSDPDPKFTPGQEVTFRLTIKNTGHEKFDKVYVKDVLPEFVEFVSGPGSYNSASREITFDIENLEPDQTEEKEIVAKVVTADKLPANKYCVVNYAEVKNDQESDKDTAQICIEKEVLGVTTIPVTGPDNLLLFSFLSLIPALSGLFLVRKSFLA